MAEMTISPEVRFVTRAGARGAGAVHFYPTRPCRSGHTSGRYVSTGKCAACVTIIRARWNAANVERKRASDMAWRAANADRVRSGCVAWRKRNPQRAKELGVLYAERHPERVRAAHKSWMASHAESMRAHRTTWKKANPEAVRASGANRRARERKLGGKYSAADVRWLFKCQGGRCAHSWCRVALKAGYHVDHVMPVARGGSNERRNLQLLCPKCNCSKSSKHPIEFARQHGMLL